MPKRRGKAAEGASLADLVPVSAKDDRLRAMAKVASGMVGWKPARQVLRRVQAVPTIFPQFDRGTRVGGLPIARVTTIHGPSNEGKMQSLDAKLLTPTGWVRMGDIRLDDHVIGSDGQPHLVVAIYPKGERDLYRVVMSDGSSTTSGDEHLWFTTTPKEEQRGKFERGPRPGRKRKATGEVGGGSAKMLSEIRKNFRPGEHRIPLVEPVQFESLGQLPLAPYALGLLLGDGCFRNSSIGFSNTEQDVVQRLRDYLPDGDVVAGGTNGKDYRVTGGRTRTAIRQLGLDRLLSEEKFIPAVYARASTSDRLSLLKGLFDTDGHVTQHGCAVEYSSSSQVLAEGVVDLVRGLGGLATINRRQTKYTDANGERKPGLPSWRVLASFPSGLVPVESRKHLHRWKGRAKGRHRTIDRIEPIGKAQCQCIAVDALDHLYVTDDYIVTHNTIFSIGLELSFLQGYHFVAHVDAEMTTPITWCEKLMSNFADHPGYLASRPSCFEEVDDNVRRFLNNIGEAKAKGIVQPETSGLVVVDSVRKLIPKGLLAKLLKEGAGKAGIDGVRGRGAQMRAALNAQWLDELVPLLHDTNCAILLIARESEDPDADANDKKFGRDFKIGGGKAIIYDASIVARIERTKWLYSAAEGGDVIGERHRVQVWKTKVAGKEDSAVDTFFHTSNGLFVPEGYDRARDVLELAREMQIVKTEGSWLHWGNRKWQGENQAVKKLTETPEVLAELEERVRGGFVIEGADALTA